MITRRALLATALASPFVSRPALAAGAAPVLFVSHGVPLFLPGNEARVAELGAWGRTLPRPRGIVVMTPHFAARTLQLGRSGPGMGMYNLPRVFKSRLPPDLDYPTPDASALSAQVEAALGARPERPARRGFDHTTWMPLKSLLPAADVPVLEVGYPFPSPRAAFELGRRLSPLRDDGVLFLASGGMTHNLAAMPRPITAGEGGPAPRYVTEFDAWATERLTKLAVDDLVDFRAKAPSAELAHPDDGAHFRVLLVALGVALGARQAATSARFPVTGLDATQSKRCVELG